MTDCTYITCVNFFGESITNRYNTVPIVYSRCRLINTDISGKWSLVLVLIL